MKKPRDSPPRKRLRSPPRPATASSKNNTDKTIKTTSSSSSSKKERRVDPHLKRLGISQAKRRKKSAASETAATAASASSANVDDGKISLRVSILPLMYDDDRKVYAAESTVPTDEP